ncbi:uncharacterized protein LOC108150403 [Drosophila elegans]|uniref:uncharacterized protein LOC108150403 n=1 Tax=Drosophila elegans TaxID=30023 RepID=UPI0007E8A718|nr:uncharacterized protein LOC108150403 [Drosophila elegans]
MAAQSGLSHRYQLASGNLGISSPYRLHTCLWTPGLPVPCQTSETAAVGFPEFFPFRHELLLDPNVHAQLCCGSDSGESITSIRSLPPRILDLKKRLLKMRPSTILKSANSVGSKPSNSDGSSVSSSTQRESICHDVLASFPVFDVEVISLELQ